MRKKPLLASMLSLFVPGLGQMYAGRGVRGAAILIAVIVVGNLNAIWLSTNALLTNTAGVNQFWAQTLPRGLHDLFAIYGVVFLIWQVLDAYSLVKIPGKERKETL